MAAEPEPKSSEILAIVREIQAKVRSRHPQGAVSGAGVELPDLTPLLHARDAAEGKVAAIGTVNPRPPGLLNNIVQSVKRAVARSLDWHVREQVEFNRALVNCVQATLEAVNEYNRILLALAERHAASVESLRQEMGRELSESFARLEPEVLALGEEARQLKDIRTHWSEWRKEWERKLSVNEVQFLRSVADLQGAFQHRVTQMESNFRDIAQAQHRNFEGALERSSGDIQKRLWGDLERIRLDYERIIHSELRVVRQRLAALPAPAPASASPAAPAVPVESFYDALRFAERFRGAPERVQQGQRFYLPYFSGRTAVADIGCGRGEFLELMRASGVPARGIDLSEECVALCRNKGLNVEKADLFAWFDAQPAASLDGVFCAQVVEHLAPQELPKFIQLAASRLDRGGVIAIETPNPECLAIFATHFFLDPTHNRPVPASLLAFYLEEAGFGAIEVHKLSPAVESMPSLDQLPADFREAFFGGLDYAVIARKL